MPFTSAFAGVPDELVVGVQVALERLREAPETPDALAAATREAVRALEATRAHLLVENRPLLDHFIEMVLHPEREWRSGH